MTYTHFKIIYKQLTYTHFKTNFSDDRSYHKLLLWNSEEPNLAWFVLTAVQFILLMLQLYIMIWFCKVIMLAILFFYILYIKSYNFVTCYIILNIFYSRIIVFFKYISMKTLLSKGCKNICVRVVIHLAMLRQINCTV